MGQSITCLITNKAIEVDKSIVHFRIRNVLFVPFDISTSLSDFIENAKNFETVSELFDSYNEYTKEDMMMDFYEETHSTLDIIKFVNDYQIEDFILEHSSDFADIPVDSFFMCVKGGNIMKDSLVFDQKEFSNNNAIHNVEKYRDYFNIKSNWIASSKFHRYSFAEKEYKNQ